MANLVERIRRGREAIQQAKSQGRDVSDWEKHLAELKRQLAAEALKNLPGGYSLKYNGCQTTAEEEIEEILQKIDKDGYCVFYSTLLQDLVAICFDDCISLIPKPFIAYTISEITEIFSSEKGKSTLKLVHEIKRQGGRRVGS